jgi:hypothetical protein
MQVNYTRELQLAGNRIGEIGAQYLAETLGVSAEFLDCPKLF